jgi:hypothetical protein
VSPGGAGWRSPTRLRSYALAMWTSIADPCGCLNALTRASRAMASMSARRAGFNVRVDPMMPKRNCAPVRTASVRPTDSSAFGKSSGVSFAERRSATWLRPSARTLSALLAAVESRDLERRENLVDQVLQPKTRSRLKHAHPDGTVLGGGERLRASLQHRHGLNAGLVIKNRFSGMPSGQPVAGDPDISRLILDCSSAAR